MTAHTYMLGMTIYGCHTKASFLSFSFHDCSKYYASCQGREVIKLFYPASAPMHHDNDQHVINTKGDINGTWVGGQQLPNWIHGPLHSLASTGKPSQILRESEVMWRRKESHTVTHCEHFKNSPHCFPGWVHEFPSHQLRARVTLSSTSSSAFVVSCFPDLVS